MKKLMFATALVASAAAFADPINAISFESYNAGDTLGANGASESNDFGTGPFFYFDGDAGVSNSSVVTNESPSAKRTAYFAETANTNNYLALDTEGGTFWRSISAISNTEDEVTHEVSYSLGDPKAVAATGTYLDTLVQFTVTEDDAPTTTSDDKLAIWLGVSTNAQGEVTGTNLMVRAKAWVLDNGMPNQIETDFAANVAIEPGTWYRLTVKAVQSVVDPGQMILPVFQIYIDGVEVTATTPQLSSDIQDLFTNMGVWVEGMATLASDNKLFPTLSGIPASLAAVTLQGVGFQGTGAVDEIVWTEEDLFPAGPTGIEFTLTWGEGVSAVSYTFGDFSTTNTMTNGTAVQLPVGDGTAQIELIPTFSSDYVFDKVTMGETDLGLTFAIPSVTTNATLLAKADTPDYPTYLDNADATIKAKYDAWKAGVGCDDATASQYQKQFLLNVDEATSVGDTALEITAITKNETAGWDITIGCSISGVDLTGTVGTAIVCNGYLAVSYTDDLTGTWTTENINITSVDSNTGTVTVNVNKSGAKFMKVKLSTTAEPQE